MHLAFPLHAKQHSRSLSMNVVASETYEVKVFFLPSKHFFGEASVQCELTDLGGGQVKNWASHGSLPVSLKVIFFLAFFQITHSTELSSWLPMNAKRNFVPCRFF